jgi:hypothetical protein
MHITSGITFGHSREFKIIMRKRARAIRILLENKKEHDGNSKGGVLMVKISEDDYYNLKSYEISDSYYFDTRRAEPFLTVSHQQLALAVNKKA